MAVSTQDTVFVRNVSIQAHVGPDSWGRSKQQPALISVRLTFPIDKAGLSDNIEDCMDYRKIYKALTSLNNKNFEHIFHLAHQASREALLAGQGTEVVTTVVLPKGLLHSEGVSASVHIESESGFALWQIHKLVIPCIIGIGAFERPRKQPVVVDVKLNETNSSSLSLLEYGRIFEVSSPIVLQLVFYD